MQVTGEEMGLMSLEWKATTTGMLADPLTKVMRSETKEWDFYKMMGLSSSDEVEGVLAKWRESTSEEEGKKQSGR